MDSLGVFTSPKRRSQSVARTVFTIASHVALRWDQKSRLLIFDSQLLFWLWRATLCGCSMVSSFFMHACLSVHSSLYCTRVCSLEKKKKKIFKGFFVVSFVARMHLEVFLCDICQCLAPLLSLPSCFICPPSPSYLLPADKCYMFSTTACWAALWYSSCQSIECDGHFFFVLND